MNMFSIRKWMFRPKKSDNTMLAQFFYADEELNLIAAELDSFDGRKDPERCTSLVNQLRMSQDKVLNIIEKIMNEVIPGQRANRDFRVKFPDDVLQESLAGQLWFGAECLAAGSLIMNREVESASMRPLAKALTRHLDTLRSSLRDQCLRNQNDYTEQILELLVVFDRLFAEFELSYVSAMVPVKTMKDYDMLQDVVVLFCETVERALRIKLLKQDQVDDYDPALMFTIPRLAIVCGLLVFPEGPLNPDMDPMNMSEMFRPFQTLLYKIRELLWTLSRQELWLLEKSLCSTEDPCIGGGLRLEEQLNSVNAICDTSGKLSLGKATKGIEDADTCKISQSGSEYSEDSYTMSHSLSSMTIVASLGGEPDTDTDSGSDIVPRSSLPSTAEEDSSGCSHHGSKDSGLLDEAEPAGESGPVPSGSGTQARPGSASPSSVEARRLRHSQSWPEPSRRLQKTRQALPAEGPVAEAECATSLEVLEDLKLDGGSRTRCRHSAGSQEFFFHLPRNTGSNTGVLEDPQLPAGLVGDTEDSSSPDQIVLTNPRPDRDDGQISFVTDALNQVFVTDPSFKGIPLSQWDQQTPPACQHIKCVDSPSGCETSAVQNRGDSDSEAPPKTCEHELNERHVPHQTNTVSHDSSVPSNCDTSFDGHSSGEISLNVGNKNRSSEDKLSKQVEEKENTESSEKELLSGSRRQKTSRTKRVHSHEGKANGDCLEVPKLKLKNNETVNSGSSRSHSPNVEYDWDRESYASSETSSYNSDSHDDEEIALAIQAAELAARQEARGRFKSSADLIHRLFVCISGVADQLQTNYASDLRHILKAVFDSTSTACLETEEREEEEDDSTDSSGSEEDFAEDVLPNIHPQTHSRAADDAEPPEWIPDGESPHCMACKVPFNFVRRRHHCRNCGKLFCGRCSSNSVPLPHYGHSKPVRVCNHCFVFQVTPFTVG